MPSSPELLAAPASTSTVPAASARSTTAGLTTHRLHPAQVLARRLRSATAPLLAGVVVLAGWALLTGATSTRLPAPDVVARTTVRELAHGHLLAAAGRTMALMSFGFGLSAVLGVAVGLLLARRPLASRAVSPYLIGLQSLPSAVWIPVAVLVLGAGRPAVLTVTVLGAIPSVALGTRDAVTSVPPLLLKAGRTLGYSGSALLRRVVLPAALPGIVSGLQHGWAFAFRSLVAGELIMGAASGGLGSYMDGAKKAGHVDTVLAAVLVILVVGLLVDRFGFTRAQDALRRRRGLGPVLETS
ncbi:MAG TPA: ABC transporter permease [Motilibacteraceae bacterium]|nr:ABC transporter permease [Motilibacteraceae bacterium]